jgi:hypothetical protein
MMTKRLCLLLVCALALVALVSACGGSGSTTTGAASGFSIKKVKRENKQATDRSVALCHQAANNIGIPADEKALMETECEYIRTGNNVGLHTVDRQLCELQASRQPEPERTKMSAQCKTL